MVKKIIAGFCGVGKSELARKYSNVIDLEIMDYKWDYQMQISNIEKRKGCVGRKRKKEWPNNYLEAIKKAIEDYDIVLISTDDEIIDLLDEYGMEYILCFPSKVCKNEYIERYKGRGNTEEFIRKVSDTFENLIDSLEIRRNKKIVLQPNETLESKLQKVVQKSTQENDQEER